MASTAHLGHSTSAANPYAFPFVAGTRHGLSIIDLRETLSALRRASNLVRSTVENNGIILFLGGSALKDVERVLQKNAEKMGKNGYAAGRWKAGTLTNANKLFSSSVSLIPQPSSDEDDGGQGKRINASHFHPSLIVLFSPLSTPYALREANALNIPTIALCDSNVDPRHFTYPIPCNDDSVRVIELISGVLAEAGKEGVKRRHYKEKADMAINKTRNLQREFEDQDRNRFRRTRS